MDVRVRDITPPMESTVILNFFGSFGKEIEEHAIQQDSARVNKGMQQDIGELAAHSCPLERKGNQGHRQVNTVEPMYQQPESMPRNGAKPSYLTRELQLKFREKGPQTGHLTFPTWPNTAIEAIRNAQGNTKARMLSFGKETAVQAIQQGNARNVKEVAGHGVNEGRPQVYNTKGNNAAPSTIAGDQSRLPRGYNDRELHAKGTHKVLESGDGSRKSSYGNGELGP
ncbi:hypothetical protein R3P38DRAFT_2814560 [Favolaschia claudopus]|uniref:Uncharacterized protein n=1 Tax=Favolaschia claudopus TaxID=2862362 RepID=A0AAV9Z2Y8_9AGAR